MSRSLLGWTLMLVGLLLAFAVGHLAGSDAARRDAPPCVSLAR
jgi:hypothetical protein